MELEDLATQGYNGKHWKCIRDAMEALIEPVKEPFKELHGILWDLPVGDKPCARPYSKCTLSVIV